MLLIGISGMRVTPFCKLNAEGEQWFPRLGTEVSDDTIHWQSLLGLAVTGELLEGARQNAHELALAECNMIDYLIKFLGLLSSIELKVDP